MKYPVSVAKILSPNDCGITGTHQAGILVPKQSELLDFFPSLDAAEYNPRKTVRCRDQADKLWQFAFIYYNNRLFGGTRNEYRLTRMTRFIREAGLKPGDKVLFSKLEPDEYAIRYQRAGARKFQESGLVLGNNWIILRRRGL